MGYTIEIPDTVIQPEWFDELKALYTCMVSKNRHYVFIKFSVTVYFLSIYFLF